MSERAHDTGESHAWLILPAVSVFAAGSYSGLSSREKGQFPQRFDDSEFSGRV